MDFLVCDYNLLHFLVNNSSWWRPLSVGVVLDFGAFSYPHSAREATLFFLEILWNEDKHKSLNL